MAQPELPVIYENPRFDAATPTLKPVLDRAIRFGGVIMLEWGTLTLIEEAPRYLKVSTVVVAVLILAVHESWPWLRLRDRRLYPILMSTLILIYAGIFAYAFFTEPPHRKTEAEKPAISADELAAAVIRSLPKGNPPVATAPPASPSPPFVSPIHDVFQKWSIAQGLRSRILRSGLSENCHVTIVRLQVPYAEDSAADFKEILDVIGWKYNEQFATSTVDRDISVRAISVPGPSKDCADAVSNWLRNSAKRRGGSGVNAPERWLTEGEAPSYLKQCPAGCIEVTFGNESN